MSQFLGDVAGMLELFAIAGGLVVLHLAKKEAPAKLLQTAGWLLIVGGVAGTLCTGYYWFKFQAQGDFAHAMPMRSMSGAMPGTATMPAMMDGPGHHHRDR